MEGRKFDKDKLRWELLPLYPIEETIKVLGYGAIKYDDHNWKFVDNLYDRYYAALMRHVTAWRKGESKDIETDLHHLAHAMCCILF